MLDVKSFLREFEDFLVTVGYSHNAALQYCSYVRNVCKKLPGASDCLEKIAEAENAREQAVLAESMNVAVTLARKDASCTVSKKRLSDYKCAVTLLIAFVSELDWVKGHGAVSGPLLSGTSEYSRRDLVRIFLARLKTQDRLSYSYGVFAARILSRIATRQKVALFTQLIENVKFLTAADGKGTLRLKEIDMLCIATDGRVYVQKKGKTFPLYTEVIKCDKSLGYEQMVVSGMRDLSLDHDTPLYEALKTALVHMPEYKQLSDAFKSYLCEHPKLTAAQASKEFMKSEYSALRLSEPKILDELKPFLDTTEITVMLSSYNTSKSKRIVV